MQGLINTENPIELLQTSERKKKKNKNKNKNITKKQTIKQTIVFSVRRSINCTFLVELLEVAEDFFTALSPSMRRKCRRRLLMLIIFIFIQKICTFKFFSASWRREERDAQDVCGRPAASHWRADRETFEGERGQLALSRWQDVVDRWCVTTSFVFFFSVF